jgi:hypothetical protein
MAKDIGFIFSGIKTEQFAIFKENFEDKTPISLSTGLRFKISAEHRTVIVLLIVSFEQKKKPIIKIEVSCHFEIKPETWSEFKEDEQFNIPADFARHLGMLTIGTVRGVLHSKTEGTAFNNFIIPTINVNDFIKEDVIIKLKDQNINL